METVLFVPVKIKCSTSVVFVCLDYQDAWLSKRYMYVDMNGYANIRKRNGKHKKVNILVHRLLLDLCKGDEQQGDHINRDRLDNRRSNLRIASQPENAQNHGAHKRWTSSGKDSMLRGVHWDKTASKWKACGVLNGKKHYLGYFNDPLVASNVVSEWRSNNMPYSVESKGMVGHP